MTTQPTQRPETAPQPTEEEIRDYANYLYVQHGSVLHQTPALAFVGATFWGLRVRSISSISGVGIRVNAIRIGALSVTAPARLRFIPTTTRPMPSASIASGTPEPAA